MLWWRAYLVVVTYLTMTYLVMEMCNVVVACVPRCGDVPYCGLPCYGDVPCVVVAYHILETTGN